MSTGITQAYLQDIFIYREDGHLLWNPDATLKKIPSHLIGNVAGTINKARGYRYIKIDGISYLAHRLVFLFHKGYLPDEVDHDNRNKLDNRIENLLDSNRLLNTRNTKVRKDSTSGLKNIRSIGGKWQVRLQINKKTYSKLLPSLEDAIEYRDQLLAELTKE